MTLTIRSDPWLDLVFHSLSYLPVPDEDASGLYDPAYTLWAERRLPAEGRALRTLPEDAQVLAGLYAKSEGAHNIQALALFYESADELLAHVKRPLSEEARAEGEPTARLRQELLKLPEPLLELFRIALYGELRGGYFSLWERHIRPRLAEGRRAFGAVLEKFLQTLPGLASVEWRLCHPLRRAGRLFDREGEPPLILVGLPGALGLRAPRAALQGCHEYVLLEVVRRLPAGYEQPRRAVREDSAFFGPRLVSLSLEAALWRQTPWEAMFRRFSRDIGGLAALSRGDFVPGPLRPVFEETREALRLKTW